MEGENGFVHHMYMANPKKFLRNFIRQHRLKEGLSLERLAERLTNVHEVEITHASLSRIERGLQPYNQRQLEAIAEELKTDPASLLIRDPSDPEGIWSLWDQAKPGERRQIIEHSKIIVRNGRNVG